MPARASNPADYPSQARYLFELYTGPDGLATLSALPGQTPKVFESNYQEFKSGQTQGEHLKQIWSKALGAFANSGGGVLVWGIKAGRDANAEIDAVEAVEPAPDVDRLTSKLKEFYPLATDPPVKGVEFRSVLIPGGSNTGFVVCYIPESDSKPHRSEFGKNDVKRFNLRIGDASKECTVPILQQLFYPKTNPRLEIGVQPIDPHGDKRRAG